jgi:hypothetical protein
VDGDWETRFLVTVDGCLEGEGMLWSGNYGSFGTMGSKDSGYVYHGDLVASTNKWKEEHFNWR